MKIKIAILGLLMGGFALHAQPLLVDFGLAGQPLEPGYQSYTAANATPASFTTQSYNVFGTSVSITPVWDVVMATAMRVLNRANAQTEANSLLRDWLGTDNRTTSGIIPVTLVISNLPAGTYRWLSYHHDAADQTGLFDATVIDAKGSRTNLGVDISNGNLPLASVTKWITTVTSDGVNPVRLRFRGTATTPTAASFFLINGFELTFLGVASEWTATGGGNWSEAGNWDFSGVPNSTGAIAIFANSILAPSTVTVNTPITVASIGLASAQSYTLAGANTLTLAGTSGISVDAGSHTISAPLTVTGGEGLNLAGAGQLTLLGNNTYTGPTVAGVSVLTISSIANGGSPSSLGASASDAANLTFSGTLRYIGSGHSSDRLFSIGAGMRTLEASGTGALNLNNPGSVGLLGTGARTLVLSGTNTGNNTLAATLANENLNATSITKNGPGKWVLTGANTLTGNISVNEGTLAVGAGGSLGAGLLINVQSNAVLDVAGAGGLTLGFGQVLQGRGSVAGNVTDGNSVINPGGTNAVGTLTFSNSLTLAGGGMLRMDLTSNTTPGAGVNDLIVVGGDVDLSSVILQVNFTGDVPGSTYRLINYSGNLVGTPNVTIQGLENTSFTGVINTATLGQVNLVLTGSPASLIWLGDGVVNPWDINTTANWTNPAIAATDQFSDLDHVTFNNLGSAASNVNLTVPLRPGSVTVNAATDYTFAGSGLLGGGMSLIKAGTGSLTLSNANTYSGATTISGGILRLGNNTALGSGEGSVTIQNGGTLDVFGFNVTTNLISVSGTGAGGIGAIANTRAEQLNAIRRLALTSDVKVSSDFRWDVRGFGGSGSFSGLFDLAGFTFTRVGTNRIAIVDAISTNAGNIVMVQGGMSLTRSIIDGPGYIDVGTNFVWIENSTTGMIAKPMIFAGGALQCSGGDFVLHSSITNVSGLTIDAGNVLTLSNLISGAGALTKIGVGTARLESANTYAGNTTINVGTLALGTNGSIGSGAAITLAAGANFDVLSQGGFTVASGKTLAAAGTINGGVTVSGGATLQVGSATNTGTLTVVNGNATLGGATFMKLNAATKTSDAISTTNIINYGGALTVSVLTGTLTPGDSYQLFNAPVRNGSFASVTLPPLGANRIWINRLAVDGTIAVGELVLSANALPGGFLQFTWPAALNGLVKLQAQTNSLNVGLSSNWGDYPGGAFNGTVHVPDPALPSVFFRLALQ